ARLFQRRVADVGAQVSFAYVHVQLRLIGVVPVNGRVGRRVLVDPFQEAAGGISPELAVHAQIGAAGRAGRGAVVGRGGVPGGRRGGGGRERAGPPPEPPICGVSTKR